MAWGEPCAAAWSTALLRGARALELLEGGTAALLGGESGVDQPLVGPAGALAGPHGLGVVTQLTQVDHDVNPMPRGVPASCDIPASVRSCRPGHCSSRWSC